MILSDKFLILKFRFNELELEQSLSSSSSSAEKFFCLARVQVRASSTVRNIINIAANAQNIKITFAIFQNYNFLIIIQNLANAIIALKNNRKFADHN